MKLIWLVNEGDQLPLRYSLMLKVIQARSEWIASALQGGVAVFSGICKVVTF